VPYGTAFSESLDPFAFARHDLCVPKKVILF
jgi:hypothetical protein